jgi:hypothetical protein
MNVRRGIQSVLAAAFLFSMCGCATVMSGQQADVTFHSNVPHAQVAIRDKRGRQVAVVESGSTIALRRKDKWVFPAKYTATYDAPGYQPAVVPIDPKLNQWVFGNLVIGGLVGLAVDNVTGAAWTPEKSMYYQELLPLSGPTPYGPMLNGATAQATPPPPADPVVTSPAPTAQEPVVQAAAATNAVPATAFR